MTAAFLMTARVTNVSALRAALGRKIADTVVRRALKQIADEAVQRGGYLVFSKGTRVVVAYADHDDAQLMAFDVDRVANALLTAKGRRVETAVFVERAVRRDSWWRRLWALFQWK